VTLEPDGRTIDYVPAQALTAGRSYTAYAYPVTDLAGNQSYQLRSFTTGAAADVQAPIVLVTSISNGALVVPTNAVLAVRFDEPVNEQTLNGIQLRQNGVPVAVDRLVSADHMTVTLKLKQLLAANTTYTFVVEGAQDLSGNALNPGRTVLFTTGAGIDLFEPVQTLRTPASSATNVPLNTLIQAQFNERINPVLVSDTVKLYDSVTGLFVSGTASVSADGLTVRFVPSVALSPNRLYYFYTPQTGSLQDLAGNLFSQLTTFTTGAQ
jgi:hypothetical protein